MDPLSRISKSLSAARSAWRSSPDFDKLQEDIDTLIEQKQVVRYDQEDAEIIEEKANRGKSKLKVRDTDHVLGYVGAYGYLSSWIRKASQKEIPDRGDPARDDWLADLWQDEPILAGAVYSMTAKMTSLRWSITGKRRKAKEAAMILSGAAHMGGYDWGGFISSTAEDFYTVNRGVFWETPRYGSALTGRLAGLGHIDALNCTLTGYTKYPMIYSSDTTGQIAKFRPGEFIHFASLPSAREDQLGSGLCAVDRAYRAAKLLIGLHDYDSEKLANLPPEGVAAVTGMTMDEFNDALTLWKNARKKDDSLTFPQVLWLIGSQPNTQVKIDFVGFSQIPESFDRRDVVRQYVSTLALDFGVDAREFWPISSGSLGTAAESEIQHLKAKGKGPGEFISLTERHINGELDDDTDFGYDTQDIEEDVNAAIVAKAWIDAYFPLTPSGGALEPIIDTQVFLRLLADKGVIPDYVVQDDRVSILDSDIHNKVDKEGHPDDVTKFVYDKGVLKEARPSPLTVYSSRPVKYFEEDVDVPYAKIMKSRADAPNYRRADGKKSCASCKYFRKDHDWCEEYEFDAEAHFTCDGWKPVPSLGSNGHNRLESVYLGFKQQEAEIFEEHRNIRGDPIPDRESARGDRVTSNTIRAEIERWRKHPLLSKYAPDEEELEGIINEATTPS